MNSGIEGHTLLQPYLMHFGNFVEKYIDVNNYMNLNHMHLFLAPGLGPVYDKETMFCVSIAHTQVFQERGM